MTLDRTAFFIDGDWAAPATGDTIEVVSPHSEEVVATVPEGTRRRHRRGRRRGAARLRPGPLAADDVLRSGSRSSRSSPTSTPGSSARWPR